jgi:hypothetical protein
VGSIIARPSAGTGQLNDTAEGRQLDPGQAWRWAKSRTRTLIGHAMTYGGSIFDRHFIQMPSLLQLEHGAHGVVVSHPLSMWEALL